MTPLVTGSVIIDSLGDFNGKKVFRKNIKLYEALFKRTRRIHVERLSNHSEPFEICKAWPPRNITRAMMIAAIKRKRKKPPKVIGSSSIW